MQFSFQAILLRYAENSGTEVTGSTLFSYRMPLTLLAVYSALSYLCILQKLRGKREVAAARENPICFFPDVAGRAPQRRRRYSGQRSKDENEAKASTREDMFALSRGFRYLHPEEWISTGNPTPTCRTYY